MFHWPFRAASPQPVKSISQADEVRSMADPADWLLEVFGIASPVASGVAVTPRTALSVPAVRAAVELIAGTLGTLPVKVFDIATNGGKEVTADHPASVIVHRDANPWTSAGALRAQLTMDALLNDQGGFAFANRRDGRVVELIRLQPGTMTVETDPRTGEPIFKQSDSAGQRVHGFRDIIHIRALASLDGLRGEAPIRTAKEAIGLCLALEQHAARLFANGGRPSGILSFPQRLGAEVAKRIKLSWQAATAGGNSGGTAVLEEGGAFTPLAFTSVDSQFAEMRAFQIVEISRAFNVPPTFLSDFSRATWSNITEANRQLVTFSLMPWFKQWEAAYRRVLLSDEDRAAGTTIEFVVDGLLQGNASERAEALSKFRSAGIMTANEARRLENLPAMDGGDVLQNPFTTSGKTPVATEAPADA